MTAAAGAGRRRFIWILEAVILLVLDIVRAVTRDSGTTYLYRR
jgi:hypothetical protein